MTLRSVRMLQDVVRSLATAESANDRHGIMLEVIQVLRAEGYPTAAQAAADIADSFEETL